jgi:hypothetical protein
VDLEWGPLSLVSTIEEPLGRKSSGSSLEIGEYGRGDPSHRPGGTLYLQKLALTSPTKGGRLVGIVRLRTQATEFFFFSPCTLIPSTYFPLVHLKTQVRSRWNPLPLTL